MVVHNYFVKRSRQSKVQIIHNLRIVSSELNKAFNDDIKFKKNTHYVTEMKIFAKNQQIGTLNIIDKNNFRLTIMPSWCTERGFFDFTIQEFYSDFEYLLERIDKFLHESISVELFI